MNVAYEYTYRIVETLDPRRPEQRWFEVWGGNPATGYEWLVAEFNTRAEARAMVKHWQEAKR